MSNKVADLLKKIEFQTDFNLEEIADKIGYSREHLTKAKNNKGGKMNIEGVYDALIANFPEISQTVISVPTLSDKDKIISLLEERVTSLKEENDSLKKRFNLADVEKTIKENRLVLLTVQHGLVRALAVLEKKDLKQVADELRKVTEANLEQVGIL